MSRRKPLRFAGVTAGVVLATCLVSCGHKTLDYNSSCKDYLNASPSEQNAAVEKIAGQLHAGDALTPLGRPNIDYICGNSPTTTLGTAIKETG